MLASLGSFGLSWFGDTPSLWLARHRPRRGRGYERRDDAPAAPAGMRQGARLKWTRERYRVAAEDPGDGGLNALVCAGSDQLHPARVTRLGRLLRKAYGCWYRCKVTPLATTRPRARSQPCSCPLHHMAGRSHSPQTVARHDLAPLAMSRRSRRLCLRRALFKFGLDDFARSLSVTSKRGHTCTTSLLTLRIRCAGGYSEVKIFE